jgi:hypothetical protein
MPIKQLVVLARILLIVNPWTITFLFGADNKMKKQWILPLALCGFALSAAANASPGSWTDSIDFKPAELITPNDPKSFTHDITDAASGSFNVGVDTVNSYELKLNLFDDWDRAWEVAYVSQPGFFGDVIYFDLSGTEYGGWSVLGQWQIQSEGKLSVTVASIVGDFYLGGSTLTVTGDRRAVPEPGTLALLGGALFGFGILRRRRLV